MRAKEFIQDLIKSAQQSGTPTVMQLIQMHGHKYYFITQQLTDFKE